MNMIDNKGRKLVPLRIDRNTVLLVTPDKATSERAKKFRKDMERSQKMALNLK